MKPPRGAGSKTRLAVSRLQDMVAGILSPESFSLPEATPTSRTRSLSVAEISDLTRFQRRFQWLSMVFNGFHSISIGSGLQPSQDTASRRESMGDLLRDEASGETRGSGTLAHLQRANREAQRWEKKALSDLFRCR